MSRLILHLFGSPRMLMDGSPVEVDTRKATALLAFLAVSGETHQRDTLAALLWPDYDQSSARAALRRTLSTLNRALDGQRPAASQRTASTERPASTEAAAALLDIARESIGMASTADYWLDVAEFHRLLSSLASHGHAAYEICPDCIRVLETAAELYREPFMAGFNLRDSPNFEEWQFFQEETLRRELSTAIEKLVCGLGASGRMEDAVQYARRWLAMDPLLEEAHRQLMLLYARVDQRNAALRQYRECVRILDQELGVAPLEETTHLYETILNRQPLPEPEGRLRYIDRPSAPPAEAGSTGTETARTPPAGINRAEDRPMHDGTVPEPLPAAQPLVGRKSEQAALTGAWQSIRTRGEQPLLVTLEGEAGIGKTRLAGDFLDEARAAAAWVIQARCYAGEAGLAYAPFLQSVGAALRQPDAAARLNTLPPGVLAEAGRLFPEIYSITGQAASPLPSEDGAQARFFESLRQVIFTLLAGDVPGVLFLDDLHWADSASLDLLTYLARRLKDARLLILAAWRSDPGETTQALERLAGELARGGQALRLELKRLGQAELVELVRAYPLPGGQRAEAFGQRLYQESEGLPFVAVEYLAALSAHGTQAAQGPVETWEMPASVRDLLRSRLAGLDATAQQLLSSAAVIGRSFDFHTLREASGRSELEAVDGLEKLLAAGLVAEDTQGRHTPSAEIRYDFTHEKLRALVYEETSLARRRLLHRRVADALVPLQAANADQPGAIAYHYQQAGRDDLAAEYHRRAGEQARRLFANVEAMAHFQAALAAGHPDSGGLHEAIGDLHTLRGEYNAAITSYQTAAALCTPGCLANLEHKLGNVHQRMGDWELAESHYLASLEVLGSKPESDFHVHLFADRSLTAHARGDLVTAQALAERALELAQSVGDAYGLAQANNALGVLARARNDQAAAVAFLEASLSAAETLDDPLARIAALNNLALVVGENGSLEKAIQLAKQALELCQKRGDRHREAALHNNLADLLHRAGCEEDSMAQLKQAVVIFADIGAEPHSGLAAGGASSGPAAIWKLTEW